MVINDQHTVILSRTGEMYVCGHNQSGELGIGYTNIQSTLIKAKGPHFVSISSGISHTVGVAYDGTVWGCGSNKLGQLGDLPTNFSTLVMTQIPDLDNIKSVVAGSSSTLLLGNDGRVRLLGRIYCGQQDYLNTYKIPKILSIPTEIKQISGGQCHYLLLDVFGHVYSFGWGIHGSLGHGNFASKMSPEVIPNLSGIISIASGVDHNLCLDNSGNVYGFGLGTHGPCLSAGNSALVLAPLKINSGIVKIDCGGYYSVFWDESQNVWMCGNYWEMETEFGGSQHANVPMSFPKLKGMQIIPGNSHVFAICPTGEVYSWGKNDHYQCGQPKESNDTIAKFSQLSGINFGSTIRMKSAATRI